MNYKFKPKKITNIVYYVLIIIVVILTVIRWASTFNNDIVVINKEINSHISNFSLSLMFYLGIGFSWTLQGATLRKITIVGIIAVIANVLCETVMGFINTTDIIDAVYGIAGTIVSFCFLLIARKYGLDDVNEDSKEGVK